jgi:hypothetical protein
MKSLIGLAAAASVALLIGSPFGGMSAAQPADRGHVTLAKDDPGWPTCCEPI